MKKVTVEAKIKEIQSRADRPTKHVKEDVAWLIRELKRHRRALNKICNAYYCQLDDSPNLDDDAYRGKGCPTCFVNGVVVKKVKP